jgi:hypothetical protein
MCKKFIMLMIVLIEEKNPLRLLPLLFYRRQTHVLDNASLSVMLPQLCNKIMLELYCILKKNKVSYQSAELRLNLTIQ